MLVPCLPRRLESTIPLRNGLHIFGNYTDLHTPSLDEKSRHLYPALFIPSLTYRYYTHPQQDSFFLSRKVAPLPTSDLILLSINSRTGVCNPFRHHGRRLQECTANTLNKSAITATRV